MTAALSLAWVGLVVAAAAFARPLPSRVMTLRMPQRTGPTWRLAGTPTARRVATAVCVALPTAVLLPVAALPVAALAWVVPALRHRQAARKRVLRVEREMPEVIDLLLLVAGAGLSVRQAVAAVSRRSASSVATELGRAVAEADRGRRLSDALDDLPARVGDGIRPVVGALTATERYGSPLVAALERLASDSRDRARRRAEEAARRVPVKLLFPLVVCILPAFALLTVAPLIASAVRTLRL